MMIVLGCVVAIDVDKDAGVDGDYGANHTDESHTCKLERDIKIKQQQIKVKINLLTLLTICTPRKTMRDMNMSIAVPYT